MIHVIASVELKPGQREAYLKEFRTVEPAVRKEKGCIAYGATMDARTDLGRQMPYRENTVTIVEQWESVAALKAHMGQPHMAKYFEASRPMVANTTLQILQPV